MQCDVTETASKILVYKKGKKFKDKLLYDLNCLAMQSSQTFARLRYPGSDLWVASTKSFVVCIFDDTKFASKAIV